jgi:hypothetical protein
LASVSRTITSSEFLFGAAARVAVELAVDELRHRLRAVAGDGDDLATRGRHHLATHHQQAVLGAADEALDHHVAAFGLGDGEGGHHFLARRELERDAAAMVGVRGLDRHRQADLLGGFPVSALATWPREPARRKLASSDLVVPCRWR